MVNRRRARHLRDLRVLAPRRGVWRSVHEEVALLADVIDEAIELFRRGRGRSPAGSRAAADAEDGDRVARARTERARLQPDDA